jgi:hypothetical protein
MILDARSQPIVAPLHQSAEHSSRHPDVSSTLQVQQLIVGLSSEQLFGSSRQRSGVSSYPVSRYPARFAMKTGIVAAILIATPLAVGGYSLRREAPAVWPHAPTRGYTALGPVAAAGLRAAEGWQAGLAPALLAEARARYGRVDAVILAEAEPLPFADGTQLTGIAVTWTAAD